MVLRDLAAADVPAYVRAFVEDPPLSRDLGHDGDPEPAEVRRRLRGEARRRERGERIHLAAADPVTDAFVGDFTLHRFNWTHLRCKVGFFVVPAVRRRGVATEALRLLAAWAFDELGLARVGMETASWNAASQALAERAGFTREGVLRSYTLERGERVDSVVFSMLTGEL